MLGRIAEAMGLKKPAAPPFEVHFSPRGGTTEYLVSLLGGARKSVRVLAYSFTSKPIADALIAAHARGVDVSVIVDHGQTAERSQADECAAAGLLVYSDAVHAIQHQKVMVIDGRTVVCGSFNWSVQAENSNSECLVTLHSPQAAALFLSNWAVHRDHSRPWGAPPPKGCVPRGYVVPRAWEGDAEGYS